MSGDAEDRKRETAQEALEHSWNWFALHAGQRMQCVNFFLVAVAFLIAAFVTALTGKHYALAVTVGLLGAWISWWFHRLELRTKELVKAGETAMRHSQQRLAAESRIEELEILKRVETPGKRWTSYGDVLRMLHWTTIVAFIVASAYALYVAGVRLCFAMCR